MLRIKVENVGRSGKMVEMLGCVENKSVEKFCFGPGP